MPKIQSESRVVASKSTVSSSLDNEQVVLDARAGKYFGLNEVAQLVWTRIQEPARVGDLFDAVLAEYEIDRAQCEKDVLELLETLAGKGLIEVHDGGLS